LSQQQSISISPRTSEIIILILAFLDLYAWGIISLIKKNNKLNERGKELREEIKQLEKLYKK